MNNEIIALEINRKIFLLISIEAFLKSRGAPLTMMKYNMYNLLRIVWPIAKFNDLHYKYYVVAA